MDRNYYYRILGVRSDATPQQIKAAYEARIARLNSEDYADEPEYARRKKEQATKAYKVLTGAAPAATRAQKEARFEKRKDRIERREGFDVDDSRRERFVDDSERDCFDDNFTRKEKRKSKVSAPKINFGKRAVQSTADKAKLTVAGTALTIFMIVMGLFSVIDDFAFEDSYVQEDYTFNYEDKLHIIIPNEIMEVIKNIDINTYHEKSIENSKLVDLAYAMLNLYGVVPLEEYLTSCYKYYNYKNDTEINLDSLFIPERFISIKAIQNENNIYIVKDDCLDDCDEYINYKVITRMEDDLFEFDFKEITLEELLNNKELHYYKETDEVIEFKEYLRDNNLDEENIDLLIGSIILSFRRDYNEGILILNETFEEEGIELNKDNIEEIMTYVNKIIDNIPTWGNKGWTNKEIILGKCYE